MSSLICIISRRTGGALTVTLAGVGTITIVFAEAIGVREMGIKICRKMNVRHDETTGTPMNSSIRRSVVLDGFLVRSLLMRNLDQMFSTADICKQQNH